MDAHVDSGLSTCDVSVGHTLVTAFVLRQLPAVLGLQSQLLVGKPAYGVGTRNGAVALGGLLASLRFAAWQPGGGGAGNSSSQGDQPAEPRLCIS